MFVFSSCNCIEILRFTASDSLGLYIAYIYLTLKIPKGLHQVRKTTIISDAINMIHPKVQSGPLPIHELSPGFSITRMTQRVSLVEKKLLPVQGT
jgi:hypothetical protein